VHAASSGYVYNESADMISILLLGLI